MNEKFNKSSFLRLFYAFPKNIRILILSTSFREESRATIDQTFNLRQLPPTSDANQFGQMTKNWTPQKTRSGTGNRRK